jgi:drug/metabolite transporter (DMT)-like permease
MIKNSPGPKLGVSSHQLGTILVVLSAIVWSTVGLFAKGIDADVWVILFWRGVFSIIALGTYVWIKSEHGIRQELANLGWPGWTSALVGAAATVCFISAFKYTSIANVSIIYAIVPFIVALLAWLLMGEKTTSRTLIAAAAALIGVMIMVGGSAGSANLFGDFLAICMAVGMAILVVIFRMYPGRPMVLSTIVSAVIHVLLSVALSSPFGVSSQDLLLLICFGVVFATATIFMIEGMRLIPASHSALISTAEAPLAPIWAWLIFMHVPGVETWIGGGLVLAALFWYVWRDVAAGD